LFVVVEDGGIVVAPQEGRPYFKPLLFRRGADRGRLPAIWEETL
jgi:hypothetical protein